MTSAGKPSSAHDHAAPAVTIVFLVFNRREELRTSLTAMLSDDADQPEGLEVIVVDNASTDGVAEMVRTDFPGVRLIHRQVNCGVSGWNDGFAIARGDYVLALDDDCYLPEGGLRRAIEAAESYRADIVSFSVRALDNPDYRFTDRYRTGLLTFWGCAVLLRRSVLEALGGYDPEIFVWANELEFTLRAFDRGFRHLHLPEVEAVHMRPTGLDRWVDFFGSRGYLINQRHFAYIAAKLLAPRDATEALAALLVTVVRDAHRFKPSAVAGIPAVLRGFAHGLRHRSPLSNRRISRACRHNFHSFASPWWTSRRPSRVIADAFQRRRGRSGPRSPGRGREYFAERSAFYPTIAATLEFSPSRGAVFDAVSRPLPLASDSGDT